MKSVVLIPDTKSANSFYIPSYEDCVAIAKANENFFEAHRIVDGVKVSIFNYRLATLQDFVHPLGESSPIQAHELRGITFVHTADGPKRYLCLHKFFNLDQTEGYMSHQVSSKKVIRVEDKADGSMIRFVPINGKLLAKTKVTFESEQAKIAQILLDKNQKLKSFVQEATDLGLAAIFEYCSSTNQIVVMYEKPELQLIQLREEATGRYLDIHDHELVKKYNVKTVKREEIESLDSLVGKKKSAEGREGWIVHLDDGQMLKIKTQWYMDRHGLLMEGLVRENSIVAMILEETLDDAMSLVGEKDVRRTYSESIQKAMAVYLEKALKEVLALVSVYSEIEKSLSSMEDKAAMLKESRKQFALQNKDKAWFGVAVKNLLEKDEEVLYKAVKDVMLIKTKGLMDAKRFVVEDLGVKPVEILIEEDN